MKGGRIKVSLNDRDDENLKKPFSILIVLATLENQDLITPTYRAIDVGVGQYSDAGKRLIQRPGSKPIPACQVLNSS